MGETRGAVTLTCAGKGQLRFRQGEPLQVGLWHVSAAFGPGKLIDREGFVVTEQSSLAAGTYEYRLDPAGILPCSTPSLSIQASAVGRLPVDNTGRTRNHLRFRQVVLSVFAWHSLRRVRSTSLSIQQHGALQISPSFLELLR